MHAGTLVSFPLPPKKGKTQQSLFVNLVLIFNGVYPMRGEAKTKSLLQCYNTLYSSINCIIASIANCITSVFFWSKRSQAHVRCVCAFSKENSLCFTRECLYMCMWAFSTRVSVIVFLNSWMNFVLNYYVILWIKSV